MTNYKPQCFSFKKKTPIVLKLFLTKKPHKFNKMCFNWLFNFLFCILKSERRALRVYYGSRLLKVGPRPIVDGASTFWPLFVPTLQSEPAAIITWKLQSQNTKILFSCSPSLGITFKGPSNNSFSVLPMTKQINIHFEKVMYFLQIKSKNKL